MIVFGKMFFNSGGVFSLVSQMQSMCLADTTKTREIFEEWLSFPLAKLQQGDCGEPMCSQACAMRSAEYLNKDDDAFC